MKLWIACWISRLKHLRWRCQLLLRRFLQRRYKAGHTNFTTAVDNEHHPGASTSSLPANTDDLSDQPQTLPVAAAGFTPSVNNWVFFAIALGVLVISIGSFII